MYVPFGVYSSFMIQDPVTLKLGETNDIALQLGFDRAGFYGSAYAFRGEGKKAGSDDTINNFGATAGYAMESEGWSLDAGSGCLRNLAASDTIGGYLVRGICS